MKIGTDNKMLLLNCSIRSGLSIIYNMSSELIDSSEMEGFGVLQEYGLIEIALHRGELH